MKTKIKRLLVKTKEVKGFTTYLLFIVLIGTATYQYAQSPKNLLGMNEYFDITKSDSVPKVIPDSDMLDYALATRKRWPDHHSGMFLIVTTLFSDQDMIYEQDILHNKKIWKKFELPIQGKYFIESFEFVPDALSPRDVGTIVCVPDMDDSTKNRTFELAIYNDHQELIEVTNKKSE